MSEILEKWRLCSRKFESCWKDWSWKLSFGTRSRAPLGEPSAGDTVFTATMETRLTRLVWIITSLKKTWKDQVETYQKATRGDKEKTKEHWNKRKRGSMQSNWRTFIQLRDPIDDFYWLCVLFAAKRTKWPPSNWTSRLLSIQQWYPHASKLHYISHFTYLQWNLAVFSHYRELLWNNDWNSIFTHFKLAPGSATTIYRNLQLHKLAYRELLYWEPIGMRQLPMITFLVA